MAPLPRIQWARLEGPAGRDRAQSAASEEGSDAWRAGVEEIALARQDDGYEPARRATMWNARTPERFPDLIVRARDEDDVIGAVRLARERGVRLAVRSGGHSWAGNHVRDGGVLLDLSGLDEATVDPDAMSASLPPAVAAPICSRSWPSMTCSFRGAIAWGWRWAATCCRAASGGTAASTARPARASGNRRRHRCRRAGARRCREPSRPVVGRAGIRTGLLRRRDAVSRRGLKRPQVIATGLYSTRSS